MAGTEDSVDLMSIFADKLFSNDFMFRNELLSAEGLQEFTKRLADSLAYGLYSAGAEPIPGTNKAAVAAGYYGAMDAAAIYAKVTAKLSDDPARVIGFLVHLWHEALRELESVRHDVARERSRAERIISLVSTSSNMKQLRAGIKEIQSSHGGGT